MTAYLTVKGFADLSVAPASLIDQVEAQHQGWTEGQLSAISAWLDSRLAKRYVAPFSLPAPIAVQFWLARLMTASLYLKRGIDPTDAQTGQILEDAKTARDEIKEAADSKEGLFELPLRADLSGSQGITKGAPLGYSEQSPYTWTDVQLPAFVEETQSGTGS